MSRCVPRTWACKFVIEKKRMNEIHKVSDKPIKYLVLSHYHAMRVLGVSGYKVAGRQEISSSQGTYGASGRNRFSA